MLFFLELASFSPYVIPRPAYSLGRNSVCVCQTAKFVRESYDALVDIFECIENFLSRLKIYTEIQPTPALTETVIKILVELLGVLALATKQINQGKLSTSCSILMTSTDGLAHHREICKKATRRERYRISSSASGSTQSRGVEDDRYPDARCGSRSGEEHGGGNGRCVSPTLMNIYAVRLVNLIDGKASTDHIRHTLDAPWWITQMGIINLVC